MAMKIIRKAILNASEAKRARGAMEGATAQFLPNGQWGKPWLLFELWRLRILAAFAFTPQMRWVPLVSWHFMHFHDLGGSRNKFQGAQVRKCFLFHCVRKSTLNMFG